MGNTQPRPDFIEEDWLNARIYGFCHICHYPRKVVTAETYPAGTDEKLIEMKMVCSRDSTHKDR